MLTTKVRNCSFLTPHNDTVKGLVDALGVQRFTFSPLTWVHPWRWFGLCWLGLVLCLLFVLLGLFFARQLPGANRASFSSNVWMHVEKFSNSNLFSNGSIFNRVTDPKTIMKPDDRGRVATLLNLASFPGRS